MAGRGDDNRVQRAEPRSLLAGVAVLAPLPFLLVGLFHSQLYRVMGVQEYLLFHNLVELFSVMVSISIFGLGCFSYDQSRDQHALFLGSAFLAIGLMDLMHTLSYAGMPDLITPNTANRATQFWVAVRFFSGLSFLAGGLLYGARPHPLLTKRNLLAAACGVSALVFVGITWHSDRLPVMLVPGVGLTPLKTSAEIVICLLMAAAFLVYWRKRARCGDPPLVYFLAGLLLCVVSELVFCVYRSAFDTYNALGHLYKTFAFMLFYRGVFVESIRKPYDALVLAHEQARQSRNVLAQIMDAVPQSIFWKDRECVYQGCNDRFARHAGVDNSEAIVGKTDFDLPWSPREAEAYREDDREVIEQARPKAHILERLHDAEGREIWIDTTKTPLMDREGNVQGVLGVYDDITESKRAADDLREASIFNQQIISCVQEGIVVYSRDLSYMVWNPYMEEMTGLKAETVLGRQPGEFFPFLEEAGVLESVKRVLAGEQTDKKEFAYRLPSGRMGWASDSNSPLYNAKGEIIGVIGTIRDITARRRTEDILRQSQKMEAVGTLAGGVAHDFNNKLTVILGYAELSQQLFTPDHEMWHHLEEIIKAGRHSRDITRQLLAFSRQENVVPQVIDLNALLKETGRTLSRLISEDIRLVFDPGDNLWTVSIDPSQVDQLLMNLLVNASDAMPLGGTITVGTSNAVIDQGYCLECLDAQEGDYVQLSIADTGTGMDPETLERIFEPFFTTKGLGKGTGLGLATVYGIVRQNSGFINVSSQPGHGTVFRIFLPRHRGKTGGDPLPVQNRLAGTGTILLVEDDLAVRDMTEAMLRRAGYTVLVAETPQDALDITRQSENRIDVILSDVIMPGMNGREMMDRIRELRPGLPVLYMSGYASDVISSRAGLEPGIMFIQKPYDMSVLNLKLQEIIDSPS